MLKLALKLLLMSFVAALTFLLCLPILLPFGLLVALQGMD